MTVLTQVFLKYTANRMEYHIYPLYVLSHRPTMYDDDAQIGLIYTFQQLQHATANKINMHIRPATQIYTSQISEQL